jgi:hypothetical protein
LVKEDGMEMVRSGRREGEREKQEEFCRWRREERLVQPCESSLNEEGRFPVGKGRESRSTRSEARQEEKGESLQRD